MTRQPATAEEQAHPPTVTSVEPALRAAVGPSDFRKTVHAIERVLTAVRGAIR